MARCPTPREGCEVTTVPPGPPDRDALLNLDPFITDTDREVLRWAARPRLPDGFEWLVIKVAVNPLRPGEAEFAAQAAADIVRHKIVDRVRAASQAERNTA